MLQHYDVLKVVNPAATYDTYLDFFFSFLPCSFIFVWSRAMTDIRRHGVGLPTQYSYEQEEYVP